MAVTGKQAAAIVLSAAVLAAAAMITLPGWLADRADTRVDEIFDEAEVELMAYLRNGFRVLVADIDDGVTTAADDQRVNDWCDRQVEIETETHRQLAEVSRARSEETRRRLEDHKTFLFAVSDYAYVGALHDEGMISDGPPDDNPLSIPLSTFMDLEIQSDGSLNGTKVGLQNTPARTDDVPKCLQLALDGLAIDPNGG